MTTAHPHTDLDEIAFTAAELIRPATVLLAAIRHAKSTAEGDAYDALAEAELRIDRARAAINSAADQLLTVIATEPVGYLPADPRPRSVDVAGGWCSKCSGPLISVPLAGGVACLGCDRLVARR